MASGGEAPPFARFFHEKMIDVLAFSKILLVNFTIICMTLGDIWVKHNLVILGVYQVYLGDTLILFHRIVLEPEFTKTKR